MRLLSRLCIVYRTRVTALPHSFDEVCQAGKHSLPLDSLWWAEKSCKSKRSALLQGALAMLLTAETTSTKDYDAAHRTRTECMRRTTEDRH